MNILEIIGGIVVLFVGILFIITVLALMLCVCIAIVDVLEEKHRVKKIEKEERRRKNGKT